VTAPSHSSARRTIGILAGNGALPGEIARAIRKQGGEVEIVSIGGQHEPELAEFPLTSVGWGEIGRIVRTFRAAGCRELILVGGVRRPDIAHMWPDMGLITHLPSVIRVLLSGGDDGVLRAVLRFFEAQRFVVLSPADVAPGLLVGAGALGTSTPSAADTADMLLGSRVVRALGDHDIGQAVIVTGGRVEAIEAAEGTDRMLVRIAERRRAAGSVAGGRRGVLVKRPKPSQEMRVDMPAIGPATVTRAAEAGLAGIAVLAGQTLAAERGELIVRANADGLFVYGFTEGDVPPRQRIGSAWSRAAAVPLSRARPWAVEIGDARCGAAALASLAGVAETGAAVVNRGYVLGIEPGGDLASLLARSAKFKAWGEGRLRRRAGVAIMGEDMLLADPIATVAAAAGPAALSGIAIIGEERHDSRLAAAVGMADRAGLFVIRLVAEGA
jgi:UDP-2,3-diacylglucosamine hydrolase